MARRLSQSWSLPLPLQLVGLGLPAPVAEFRFCPPRRYRFDFAYPDAKVGIEIEGGVYIGGRHVTGTGYEQDCAKYSLAAILGWRVIRATTGQVERGDAAQWIRAALAYQEQHPETKG